LIIIWTLPLSPLPLQVAFAAVVLALGAVPVPELAAVPLLGAVATDGAVVAPDPFAQPIAIRLITATAANQRPTPFRCIGAILLLPVSRPLS
jgi:hypothetical protein